MISTYRSDIILKWNDMRTKFGYNELGAIAEQESDLWAIKRK